nr:cyclin-D2-2-like [Physcomitrium patens]|eukprot:XP_024360428.1 cyclin-D2-2-like [Physcomitrella patens]
MCLKDYLLVGEQKGKQVMQLTMPKSIKPDKVAVAEQMLLPLAECSTGGEACTILLSDLLCGETLSPTTTTYCHHQFGELHNDSIATTSAFRGWLVNAISASIPYPAHGSSFLSKSKENLCSKLNRFSHTDDTATIVVRKDPAPETMVVRADSVSKPSLVDLGEAMRVLQEREVTTPHRLTDRYINTLIWSDLDDDKSYVGLGSARREGVFLIFKLVEDLGLGIVIGAHAIAYLDRFLSTMTSSSANSQVDENSATHFPYIAAACVLIAAKMDDTAAPSLASLCRFSGEANLILGKLRDVEVVVLQVLGWKLLAVTTSDFVDNMLAHLPLIGVSSALVQGARSRADELLQAILTEVEFLDFEQSTIGLCVMQCILDETLPLQAALHMAALQSFLVVDMFALQQCHKRLVDLVSDPVPRCSSSTSPASVLHA